MRVAVTGGAGYIGSHTVLSLLRRQHEVVVVDDLSNSSSCAIERVGQIAGRQPEFHRFDVRDADRFQQLLTASTIDAVIHCAGKKAVAESVAEPVDYYRTNIDATLSVVEAMQKTGVRQLVFSSSATVYGPSAEPPMSEEFPLAAVNPYGWTKVMIEQILRDLAAAEPTFRIAVLRYFNPVGADKSGLIGENPRGVPNNLMPIIVQVAARERDRLQVFGNDYDTADGTGVRDYCHVSDIADGHLRALAALPGLSVPIRAWNLGTGSGTSVLELVHAFEQATGRRVPYELMARRPGDVAASYADPSRAERELGWRAQQGIEAMCADAWRWKVKNPEGFPAY
jgi:UDP-glucose 4-epimerase